MIAKDGLARIEVQSPPSCIGIYLIHPIIIISHDLVKKVEAKQVDVVTLLPVMLIVNVLGPVVN